MLRKWEKLPKYMQTEAVRPYYDILKKKEASLYVRGRFEFLGAVLLSVILLPVFIIVSILIVRDSKGGVFYRQERVTQYGRKFKIFKFRTMVENADQIGTQVTVKNDNRVTKIGRVLRKYRLDEIPQLFNIILGDMTFVGTRPESVKYVKEYTPEMFATLLLPAGVTSETSILYKDEEKLLEQATNVDEVYIKKILHEKMIYNLESVRKFGLCRELKTMIKTVLAVVR